ncbi:MurR/RpiR family transcriptional regulator [Anaerococcus urinomassiliensis]|uniref:MurR/RpiR family transcriptional regulator n=1 Tax=Anaerococcus urinomassiliensis TaxID=1745712 RepID=UPI00093CE5CF|nr:MurR/RpiR family transcriptional regulator [Anaerococcus urinomassiliensis]
MNNVFIKLKSYYPSASNSEKILIDYMLNQPDEVINYNIRMLSKKTFTSPATIIRLCKNLNFTGFQELKNSLIYNLAIEEANVNELSKDISEDTSISDMIDIITNKNQQAIINTGKLNDEEDLLEAIRLIESYDKVYLFGMGSSLLVAMDMRQKFLRVNRNFIIDQDWHLQLLNARNADENTLAIIFSYSGETHEMLECTKSLYSNNAKIILITGFINSPIAKKAEKILQVAPIENIVRTGAVSSRIAQLNIVDLLYNIYIIRNYDSSIKKISKNYIVKEEKEFGM